MGFDSGTSSTGCIVTGVLLSFIGAGTIVYGCVRLVMWIWGGIQ